MHLVHGNINREYRLDNEVLDCSTHSEKDLGIWITDDMKLEYQTTETCKKNQQNTGTLNGQSYTKHILVALYKSSSSASRVLLLCLVAKIRERQGMPPMQCSTVLFGYSKI